MTENSDMEDNNTFNAQELAEAIDPEGLREAIAELEQYRERLVNETIETAKKAKLMKSAVMAQLEPQLAEIDTMLANFRQQQAAL